jgi:branched-chain amino acid transport system permease protein
LLFTVISNITKSKTGIEFRTIDLIAGSEVAAETIGINVGRIKTRAFVLSAVYAAIGGSLYAHYITHLDPGPFSLWSAFMFVIMVVIGGPEAFGGPFLGLSLLGLKELISFVVPTGQSGILAGYDVVVFSLLFISVLLFSLRVNQVATALNRQKGRNNNGILTRNFYGRADQRSIP